MSNDKSSEVLEVDEVFEPYLAQEADTDNEVYQVSLDEVESAYRSAVKDLHPDQGGHVKAFRRMQDSYEMLSEEIEENAKIRARDPVTEPANSSGPDYEVSEEGYIDFLDEAIEEVRSAKERMQEELFQEMDGIVGEELEQFERVEEGEDPEDVMEDSFPF